MKKLLSALLLILSVTEASAATLRVCAGAGEYLNNQLQTAMDVANPGDVIFTQANFLYIGDFILPNQKSCPSQTHAACDITIQTGVDSSCAAVSAASFPATNVRITPSYVSILSKFQSSSANTPAFRTTYPGEVRTNCAGAPCVTKWWKFSKVEFAGSGVNGGFSLLSLGSNDTGGLPGSNNLQDTLAEVPSQFILDQVYLHGDSVRGQKQGIIYNAKDTQILNSYISDIKYVGQDACGICIQNSPGNLTITNTLIQGAGESIISGGTDIRLTQTRTPTASTTTTITLNSAPVDLSINQSIACQVGGSAQSNIRNSLVSNIVGSVVTVSPAFAVACDVPVANSISSVSVANPTVITTAIAHGFTSGELVDIAGTTTTPSINSTFAVTVLSATTFSIPVNVTVGAGAGGTVLPRTVEWNTVPFNGSLTKSILTKDPNWINPLVPTPQNVIVTTSTTGGTLPAGTDSYRVVAKITTAGSIVARSTASAEISVTTTGTTSSNTIKWNPVANAEYYFVYGRSAGGENFRQRLAASDATCVSNAGLGPCQIVDINTATSGACANESSNNCTAAVPTSTGTLWQVKNIFELKNWDTFVADGDIFDYSWLNAQTGYAILFTIVNQDGGNYGNVVQNITLSNSKIRHANGGVQITGTPSAGGFAQKSNHITLSNLSFEDIGDPWHTTGSTERSVLFNNGPYPAYDGPDFVTFNHITLFQTGGSYTFVFPDNRVTNGGLNTLVVKNSMFRRLFYGSLGASCCSEGNNTWTFHTYGSSVWTKNVNVGANCSLYPSSATNYCPTEASWQSEFVDYAGGNYRLKSTSTYHNAADDGTDIGANYNTIEALTNIALSGDNSGGAPPPPQPTISTTSPLPQATVGNPYSTTLVGICSAVPCTWSGTPGNGLILGASTGIITGSPLSAGTSTFPITFTDAIGQSATTQFTLTAIVQAFPEPRPDKLFYNEGIHFRRPVAPDITDQVRVGDLWSDTSQVPPVLNVATATAPNVVWAAAGGGIATLPAEFSVAGSAATWAPQITNLVFASPNGSTGTPLFRSLVSADFPTAIVDELNTGLGTLNIGTADANPLNIKTNGVTRVNITSAGDIALDPGNNQAALINITTVDNTDTYSLGMPTSQGNKIYLKNLIGTSRNVCGFSDAGTTETMFGCSASSNSGTNWTRRFTINFNGDIGTQVPTWMAAAPTISAGFGTSPAILSSNGSITFRVNVGTGGTATTGTIGLTAATNGWNCMVSDFTTNIVTRQTGGTTTTVVVTAASAWTASDTLIFMCAAY